MPPPAIGVLRAPPHAGCGVPARSQSQNHENTILEAPTIAGARAVCALVRHRGQRMRAPVIKGAQPQKLGRPGQVTVARQAEAAGEAPGEGVE